MTISHWRLQTESENYIRALEEEAEDDDKGHDTHQSRKHPILGAKAEFPPPSVSDKRHPAEAAQLSTIRELSMSLVFTGDRMGRCWTCSILSEVIDEEAVQGYTKEINDILQMFIHQQYSGRMLSFILLLGYLCESLSKECEKFTAELDKIMGMDVSTPGLICVCHRYKTNTLAADGASERHRVAQVRCCLEEAQGDALGTRSTACFR